MVVFRSALASLPFRSDSATELPAAFAGFKQGPGPFGVELI